MKPSFLRSTLSFAFILCVISIIVMGFTGIEPSKELLAAQTGIIAGYLSSRNPRNDSEPIAKEEEKTTI